MNEELANFAASILEDTQLKMDDFPTPELAFTAVGLDRIVELLDCTEPVIEHCKLTRPTGDTIGEIHAYAESVNGDVLYLFYTDYNPIPEVRTKSIVECQPLINRPQGFYNQAVRGAYFDADSSSSEYQALRFIYDNDQKYNLIKIVVLSNYIINNLTAKRVTLVKPLITDTWDLKKLFANTRSTNDFISIDIDFDNDKDYASNLPCLNISSDKFTYQCFLTVFPAKLIYNLYAHFSNDLFSYAQRDFIGFKGTKSPNAIMKKSLIFDSDNFLAYNGGITAVAKGIKVKGREGKPLLNDYNSLKSDIISYDIISFIREMKIVDGIQTISSIYYSKQRNPLGVNLDSVFVPVKIIVPMEDEVNMTYNVSVYSHSRNKEDTNSFSILPFSLKMKMLSKNIIAPNKGNEPLYWFFQRTKNQYKDLCWQKLKQEKETFLKQNPKDQIFDIDVLSKVWLSWNQQPANAIKGKGAYLTLIDDGRYLPDDNYFKRSIALIIIYKFLLSNLEKSIERKYVAVYTMAYLSLVSFKKLNLIKIWTSQELSTALESFLKEAQKCIKEKLNESAKQVGLTLNSYCRRSTAFAETIVGIDMTTDIRLLLNEYE